jgi:GMP synthase-like glutamine amidotransferase
MRSALVVQHIEPEGPWLIAEALAREGVAIDLVRPYRGDAVPADLGAHRGLVVMGGPMSAASDDGFPSRGAELALMRDAVARRVPTLGVCLGAQLLAVAAGGAIHRGPVPEIGWGPVRLEAGAEGDPLLAGLGGPLSVLHWHGETFDLPAGAIHLARSDVYANQAFRVGPAAWGLQFHIEVDLAAVEGFMAAFGHEAPAGSAIAEDAPRELARSDAERRAIMERFARVVGG